jgi:uncharacterized protein (DUF433 family)
MNRSRLAVPAPLELDEDGAIRLSGTRVTFESVVGAYERGASPEEIVEQYPSLRLSDVYFALGYYLSQQPQILDYLVRHRQQVNEARTGNGEAFTEEQRNRFAATRAHLRNDQLQRVASLWAQYVQVRSELEQESYIRSNKSLESELAEWLVKLVFNGEPLPGRSNKGYDVLAGDKRIEVKSISKRKGNSNGYTISERDRANDPQYDATHYAFVFFLELVPDAVFLVPEDFVRTFDKKQIHRYDLESAPHARVSFDLTPFAVAARNSITHAGG